MFVFLLVLLILILPHLLLLRLLSKPSCLYIVFERQSMMLAQHFKTREFDLLRRSSLRSQLDRAPQSLPRVCWNDTSSLLLQLLLLHWEKRKQPHLPTPFSSVSTCFFERLQGGDLDFFRMSSEKPSVARQTVMEMFPC